MLNTHSVGLGKTAEAGASVVGPKSTPQHWLGWLSLPVGLALLLALWAALSQLYPPFILPGPADVAARFAQALADGTLARHLSVTLVEALLGFSVGFLVAVILGYGIAKQPLVERIVSPYVVASQAVPIVALAPLLILWFGHGLASKVLVCALVVFFPILVNTVVALRSVDPQSRELMHSLNASRWHTLTKLELPASLPIMFGGIRMGVTLCVIGAVVGEFVGADTGLGALVNLSRGMFDTSLMFVALFTLVALAMSLYAVVILVERLVTRP
ncbi:MAG: ABC transporter permease [Anaerolineae bacterium]